PARPHEAERGAPRYQRHAERLALADRNVRAARTPLPGRLEEREGCGVDDRDHEDGARARPVGKRIDVLEAAEEVRLLHHERRYVLPLVAGEGRAWGDALRGTVRELLELQSLLGCGAARAP